MSRTPASPTTAPDRTPPPYPPRWNRQRPSPMPWSRYEPIEARVELPLTDRRWPSRRLTRAPLWVPVDLRDGNQALAEPMDPARKRRFFDLLVRMGYTEIEVGYPSASQADFDFVRDIAAGGVAPDDVTIIVFTPARRDLIRRTVESIEGVTNPVVIHMYAATAPIWRDVVLGRDRAEMMELVLDGARDILAVAGDMPNVRFQFSPEVFNLTEPDFALEICDAVTTVWDASPDRPVILNLPATVEIATPNVYADQIEYMDRSLARRDGVILSIHPHNDRGTAVAAAELALLAGAERVEGCIFGNGERTGNVDLVTLALNLFSQGVDPMVDLSDLDGIRRTVEECNRIDVHPRHPYAGDLVHTAFSGTHQDAIRKGFAEHRERARTSERPPSDIPWRIPYLPVDPSDIGRTYEAVIRVNSQSGKGGMAYLLESAYGLELPRHLQVDFSRHIQARTDATGGEMAAPDLWDVFEAVYLPSLEDARVRATGIHVDEVDGTARTTTTVNIDGSVTTTEHVAGGPVEALVDALATRGIVVDIVGLHQTSVGTGSTSDALTCLEYRHDGVSRWTAGRSRSVLGASLDAVIRAANAVLDEASDT